MGVGKSIEKGLVFGITALFIISSFGQMTTGYDKTTADRELIEGSYENYIFDRYDGRQTFESSNYEKYFYTNHTDDAFNLNKSTVSGQTCSTTGGPIDSPWPMKCHDTHHTGRSPYGTANNSYYELWSYKFDRRVDTDPAIGDDGAIYVGGSYEKLHKYLYAINPDGTMRWRYRADGFIWHMCPAIAEDGTIYFGAWDYYLHAVNPNGTRKWRFYANANIVSDPVIGEDGTIYFGTMWTGGHGGKIFAVNPDGYEKWRYQTGDYIISDPAIGDDGTIYIGSDDRYLYAMNPNGTLKWRFKTGDWIHGSPSIADDGTIYISSYDDYLYALYPNGTLRWKTNTEYGSDTNPSIGSDGTIYLCVSRTLFAINPNGSTKWEFNLGGSVMKSSPAICADGTIYVGIEIGDMNGGEIVAVNPDGTLRWRKRLSNQWVDSSPCIGEDGIVYIISSNDGNSVLHAFGTGGEVIADANGPYYGLINVPLNFSGSALYGYPPYTWIWDFGDGDTSNEQNPTHIYDNPGNYTVILNVSDDSGNTSEVSTWAWIQESNDPPNKPIIDGPKKGKTATSYDYTFVTTDPEGVPVWYYIEWGDGQTTGWIGPYPSGKVITQSYEWGRIGKYTIRCKAKDPYGDESEWGELKVTMPKNHQSTEALLNNSLFFKFIKSRPRTFQLMRQIAGLE